ncbi:MAG: WecB/TagA/CpsF family glycosyltransferase [Clostridium sp.]|nr:WecB/TagA/CpsF family glycosyltransferase [Clostridium sp.]
MELSKMKFMNTYVHNITMKEVMEQIDEFIVNNNCRYVVTPNVNHITMIEKSRSFREIYDNASLVLTDGTPLIWISKLYKTPIKEKISGSDLLPSVLKHAASKKYSVFLLGAAKGVAELAAKKMTDIDPELNLSGVYSPPMGFERDKEEVKRIINKVRSVKPDILVLGLGSPKQEQFIYKYRKMLGVPVTLCTGAAIDFLAGKQERAPKWMQKCGLEWLYRTIKEPKRLAKRYIHDGMAILPLIWKYRTW